MLESWGRSADLNFVSIGLGAVILLFDQLGYSTPAATLSGALTKSIVSTDFIPRLADAVVRVRQALGDGPFDEASRRGAAMTHGEIVIYASDQIHQALAAIETPGSALSQREDMPR